MYYNKTLIENKKDMFLALFNEYKNQYDKLKEITGINSAQIIWTSGYGEPFNADYLEEISHCRCFRGKILQRTPKDIKDHSQYHYDKDGRVISCLEYMNGSKFSEKFYIYSLYKRIGIRYSVINDSSRLNYMIDVCNFNQENQVVSYDMAYIDRQEGLIIETSNVYVYDGNTMIEADSFSHYVLSNDIHLYDEDIYKNVVVKTPSIGIPHLNPEYIEHYFFHYNADGYADSYTRINYIIYNKISEHTWKIPKTLVEKQKRYNVNCFIKDNNRANKKIIN